MNCAYCGTALPEGALFCGECGRSVGTIAAAALGVAAPPAADPPTVTPPTVTPPTTRPEVAQPDEDRCRQCGAPMSPGDIFCGECGSVSHNVSEIFSPRGTGASQATHPAPEPERDPQPAPEPAPAPELASTPAPAPSRHTVPETRVLPRLIPPPLNVASVFTEDLAFEEDMESTRIVSRKRPGDRFVLQFSTGESVTVFGSGLIGRNPHAEPGEHFDHIVRLLDATRSVSKTHVEFGQEAGAFWIKDRYSGNGTVIREPDTPPLRCLPDRRHRLARGSRVDIGEQFFVVS